MRQSIKLIIKKGKIRQDGTSLIFLQYCHSKQRRVLISTDIAIPEIYWNKKNCSISSNLPELYGKVYDLELQLREKARRAEQIVDYALRHANTDPLHFLKKHFKNAADHYLQYVGYDLSKRDVFYQIDMYIQSKVGIVKSATLVALRSMKKHLLCFQDFEKISISFDSFDAGFYQRFIKFLTYEIPLMRRNILLRGLKINTIGKTIKHLKSFLKDRIARKLIPYIDISCFKYMEEEVDAVYLDWTELSHVYHLDLSEHAHLCKYRDLFILACLTGFRFSDFSELQASELRKGMLHVVQKKTCSVVIVPLREDARVILIDKYQMQLPKVSMVNFNYCVKEVARIAGLKQPIMITHRKGNKIVEETRPKYAWISSHTARRSFCTNEYLAGTPADLIMTVSGHKSEKAFRRYIKADKIQKAYMIKQLWDSRPGL